jgi:hypothetical protein
VLGVELEAWDYGGLGWIGWFEFAGAGVELINVMMLVVSKVL